MKRLSILLFLCVSYGPLFGDMDESYIQDLVNERIIERTSQSFTTVPGSLRFIEKFKLNEKEIELIGIWGFDGVINKVSRIREYGPGISITFYPNRYFCIYREFENQGQIKQIIGKWKVENGNLLIRLKARIIIVNSKGDSVYTKNKVEYCDSFKYYQIFTVPTYDIIFVNTQPFDWGEIPLNLRNYYEIPNNDKPRSRLLFDSLGTPPGNIQEGSCLGDLLYNPEISDRYFIDIAYKAW